MSKDKKEFSTELYEKGKRLIECLDKEGFNYPVALWIDFPDKDKWILLLGVPGIQLIGSNDVSANVKRIIREGDLDISIDDIMYIDSLDRFCVNLRTTVRTGKGITRIGLSSKKINNQIVPQMVIYRVN